MSARWRVLRFLLVASLLGGATVLTAFVALVLFLRSETFQELATGAVEHEVEWRTGEQLTLGAIDVDLWPPAVQIDGVNLWDADTGDSIATVEHVRAPVVLREGGLGLGQLVLTRPVVQLHIGEDGKLVEFEDAPRRQTPSDKPAKMPWSSLFVDDGTFRVFYPKGQAELRHILVSPVDGPKSDIHAKVSVQVNDLLVETPIDWPGCVLGPDRFEIPELTLDTEQLSLEGRVGVILGGDVDIRLRGSSHLESLDPVFVAPNALYGDLEFDAAVTGSPNDPQIELAILGQDLGLDRVGKNWPLLRYRLGTLSAAISATKDGATIERGVFQWGDGSIVLWGKIGRDLSVTDGHALAEHISLAQVFRQYDLFMHPWVDMDIDGELTISGSLKPMSLSGDADLALAELAVHDRDIEDPSGTTMLAVPYGSIEGSFSFTNEKLVIDGTRVETPHSYGKAHAEISTGSGPVVITADFAHGDLRDLRPLGASDLYGTGPLHVRVDGQGAHFEAKGHASMDNFSLTGLPYADHIDADVRTPDMLKLYFENVTAKKGQTPYSGDLLLDFGQPTLAMNLDLDIPRGGRAEDVVGVFIDLPGLTGEMGGKLTLDGPLYDLDGVADLGISEVSLWGEEFPVGHGHAWLDDGVFVLDDLRVTRDDGHEGIVLRGGIDRQWALNMEVIGDGLRLETLDHLDGSSVPVTGTVGFLARVDNTLFDPAPHGRLFATDVRWAGKPVEDSLVQFSTEKGVMHYGGRLVGSVDVDGTLGLWGEQPYSTTAKFDKFPAHVVYPMAADGNPIEATVSGSLALNGHFGDDPSPVDIVADATDVHVSWGNKEIHNQGEWHYEQHGRDFELENFSLAGGASDFVLSAEGGSRPFRVEGEGTVDLDWLRTVVPGLSRVDGTAHVAVEATGKRPDVEAAVKVELRPGDVALLRHDSFPGTFEDVTATITGTADGYDLVNARASLGGGEVVGEGHIVAEGWVPKAYNLTAFARNAQVQWADWLPPATGNGQFTFRGPSQALLLSGDVDITEMTFSDRIDWEDWVVAWREEMVVDYAPNDAPPYFSFDVGVTADDTIKLRNNVVEGSASADLRVIGDTSRPGLVGDVVISDGLAYLQDREFVVDRGVIAFRDPWSWDPDVDFDLVTDITSQDRRYRVNYAVTGLYSDWRTETRSDPPLPQSDVNALLWFGMTADEIEDMGDLPQAIGQGVADMLVADFFVSQGAAQDLRGEIPDLLDRIDLVTGVDARGEYSPDPRLRVEKRLPDLGNLEVTGEIDLTRTGDQYWRVDRPLSDDWSLAVWYATRQRDRTLPIGGAYGVDLRARWEAE